MGDTALEVNNKNEVLRKTDPIYSETCRDLLKLILNHAAELGPNDGSVSSRYVIGDALVDDHPRLEKLEFSPAGISYVGKEQTNRGLPLCPPFAVKGASVDDQGRPVLVLSLIGGREVIIRRSMVAAGGKELAMALSDLGLDVTPAKEGRELLQEVLTWVRPPQLIIATQMGWLDGLTAFVLPSTIIGDTGGSRVILDQAAVRHLNVGQLGDYDAWKRDVATKCRGNSRLITALACGVAAPLLPFTSIGSFIVHFWGVSSIGKSIALAVGGSTSGGSGSQLNYANSFDGTANAHMHRASRHNGTLVCIDELKLLKSDDLNNFIYQTTSGAGRARLNKNSSAMPTPAWRTVTVTSGEITYREAADDALKSSRKRFEGADARAVGIPADAGKGLGIFDTIHDAPDSRRFAEELKAATHRDYGHVLPAFVMKLNELRADLHGEVALRAHLQRRMDKQLAKLGLPPDAPNHVVRAAQAFAVLATAGTLAAEWGLFGPITATEVEEAVATCFRAYMKDRGAGHTTELTVLKELRNLIQTNPVRFPKVQSNGTLRGESVRDIAGYTKEIRKQSYFLLFPPTLDEILKVAPRAKIFDELRKRSLLLCNKGRNDYRVRIGQLTQFYAISSRILSLNDEGVVIEDEEEVEDEPKRTKTRKVDDDEVPNRAKPKRKRPADIDDDGEDDLKSGVLQ